MAEKQEQKDQGKDAGREAKRAGSEARQSIEVATDRTAEVSGGAARAGGRAMQQGMQTAGQAAQHGLEAAGRAAQRNMQATAEGAREILDSTASRVGELSQRMAQTAQQTTEDLRTLMTLPSFAGGGFQEMQQAMTGMLSRIVQINVKATQEVFRFASPGAVIELQQRFARQYLHGLIEGSAEMLRVSRRIADEALKPIEERTQQMRHQFSEERNGGNEKVADVMTPGVEFAKPDQSVQEAAQLMAQADTGAVPVGENDRLVGMITDRDIAIRVTAEGKDPKQTRVREVMTPGVRYCFEDEDVGHVAENMAEQQVRRMPVVNREKRLVGVVSLGDISTRHSAHMSGAALRGISQRGGQHQQSAAYAGNKPEQES